MPSGFATARIRALTGLAAGLAQAKRIPPKDNKEGLTPHENLISIRVLLGSLR